MLNIAICDDDNNVINEIEKLLLNVEVTKKVKINVFYDGTDLVNSILQGNMYDLIYLDIEMGKENGITSAHRIRKIDRHSLIIYVTSHSNFAKEAFEVNAFRFLSKPIMIIYNGQPIYFDEFSYCT